MPAVCQALFSSAQLRAAGRGVASHWGVTDSSRGVLLLGSHGQPVPCSVLSSGSWGMFFGSQEGLAQLRLLRVLVRQASDLSPLGLLTHASVSAVSSLPGRWLRGMMENKARGLVLTLLAYPLVLRKSNS